MMKNLRARFGTILVISMAPALILMIWLAGRSENMLLSGTVVFAFLFGISAIWLSTNLLIFKPLRDIGRMSSLLATGDLSARIGPMQNGFSRFSQLTDSFNSLADNISAREAAMLESLAEKEILLREIHHRVKNNLQIIISLLNMQERKASDPKTVEIIRETRSRINAIALVHRGLYEGNDISVIQMDTFLGRLISELKIGLATETLNVEIVENFEPQKLEPDTAIPVALFVVETLTNAIQHGVSDGGTITLTFEAQDEHLKMKVEDSGQGFQENVIKGTGSKLISGFARQLSGKIVEDHTDGYGVSLIFDKPH